MIQRFLSTTRLVTTLATDELRASSRREQNHRLLRLGLLTAAALLATVALTASAAEPARVAETLYNVELVIVRPVTPIGVPEDWTLENTTVRAASAAPVEGEEETSDAPSAPATSRLAVRSLTSAQYRLAGVDAAIARSRNYELLRHVGWTQAPTARGAGLSVELADISAGAEPLRGTVSLERGRYLHLKVDLAYSPQTPPNSLMGTGASAGPVTFTLRQTRRVKPFERHYFDHPAFGVIAMISPVGGRQ